MFFQYVIWMFCTLLLGFIRVCFFFVLLCVAFLYCLVRSFNAIWLYFCHFVCMQTYYSAHIWINGCSNPQKNAFCISCNHCCFSNFFFCVFARFELSWEMNSDLIQRRAALSLCLMKMQWTKTDFSLSLSPSLFHLTFRFTQLYLIFWIYNSFRR